MLRAGFFTIMIIRINLKDKILCVEIGIGRTVLISVFINTRS